ncbi:MAG: ferritin [Chthonomonadales bacterium]
MLITQPLVDAINAEIGRELESSNQYLAIATFMEEKALRLLAKLFYEQSDEERTHALKFVHYLSDVGGEVRIPPIPAPDTEFDTVEAAVKHALDWELTVTRHINDLMALAISERDYAAQDFLRWFVTEQIEEVRKMEDLLKITKAVGERNIAMVEAYLAHKE